MGVLRVRIDVEGELVGRDRQAGLFRDPADDVLEHGPQEVLIKMALVAQRKIEILRKPVRFEITFFKTGAAFENPALGKARMRVDAAEQPAEDVVLLDVRQKLERRCGVKDFALVDYGPCLSSGQAPTGARR